MLLLPPELIDRIFSFLWPDIPALEACSKAHPLYSTHAARYFYADIVVDPLGVFEFNKLFSENPSFLHHPRSLEMRALFDSDFEPRLPLLVMPMITRMANLVSLRIVNFQYALHPDGESTSTVARYLPQLSIEQLYLSHLYDFPLSVLDYGTNIKKLTLSHCTAKEEPISSSPLPQESLETLILSYNHSPHLYIWAMHRVTRLTSLGLQQPDLDWKGLPELLTACSNSLTTLHLDVDPNCPYGYIYDVDRRVGYWIDNGLELPFTLSALTHLKNLAIFSPIYLTEAKIASPLPEIIRLINTAPGIDHVALDLLCQGLGTGGITTLGLLDWSPLDCLQSNFTGTHPRIDLGITNDDDAVGPLPPDCLFGALAGNPILMDLVERGLVTLKSERTLALWEG